MPENKIKILAILHIPPPKHGASSVGNIIMNSQEINNEFCIDYVRLSTTSVRFGIIGQIYNMVLLYLKVTLKTIFKSYNLIYITPCASGMHFYKDFFVTFLAKLFSSTKIVYHFHNKGLQSNKHVPICIKQYFFNSVSTILLSSLLDYDVLDYTNRNSITYLPNGIGHPKKLKRPKEPNKNISLLFLSNMICSKGVFVLLEACRLLKNDHIKLECKFVGPWYQVKEKEFTSFIEQHDLSEMVKYLGAAYDQEKEQIMISTDIFIFPTFYPDECFPLVLLEAMSHGLPCITTNIAAIPEIITHEKEGLIVPPKNSAKLAGAIKRLIKDNELRRKMGENAHIKYCQKYTQRIFEENFIKIMKAYVNKGKNFNY